MGKKYIVYHDDVTLSEARRNYWNGDGFLSSFASVVDEEELQELLEEDEEISYEEGDDLLDYVPDELKEAVDYILGQHFHVNDIEVVRYSSGVTVQGQFLNYWNPTFGAWCDMKGDKFILSITTYDNYCAEMSVHEEEYVFQKKGSEWVCVSHPWQHWWFRCAVQEVGIKCEQCEEEEEDA